MTIAKHKCKIGLSIAGVVVAAGLVVPVGMPAIAASVTAPAGDVHPFAYVTHQESDTVSVIDTKNGEVIKTVTVEKSPIGVATSSDGTRAYVTNYGSNTLSIIDGTGDSPSVTATIGVGGRGPTGVAVSSDGDGVYVTNSDTHSLSVVDTGTHAPAAVLELPADRTPDAVAMTPDGSRLYVANDSTGKVTVVSNTLHPRAIATVKVGDHPTSVAITPDGRYAYVANATSGTVSVIDTTQNSVTRTIQVGEANQITTDVAITPDGSRAYVTGGDSNKVSVIDTGTGRVTRTIRVGQRPQGVTFTPDGRQAYVTNNLSGNVSVIDTGTGEVTGTIDVGHGPGSIAMLNRPIRHEFGYVAGGDSGDVSVIDTSTGATTDTVKIGGHPTGVAVTPDGARAYVTDSGSHTVSMIDTHTHAVSHVDVGNYPSAVAVTPDGTHAYVTNTGSNSVSVINNGTVTGTISVGKKPEGVAISPDGTRAYVTNSKSKSVSVIDTSSGRVTETIGVGKDPVGVAVLVDGSRVYVTNAGSNTVSVIDTSTGKITATISVGSRPGAVALTVDGSDGYVTNGGSNTVSVINTSTGKVTATIKVGTQPGGVAVTDDGTRGYITNSGTNTVSVISTLTNAVTTLSGNVGSHPIGIALGAFRQPAVVSIGDSFISGVAGRWRGNAAGGNTSGDNWGTDRAVDNCDASHSGCTQNADYVYGSTSDGCLRADSAEVNSADLGSVRRINLACSGAKTANVIPASAGGQWLNGEAPEADQLRYVAQHNQVTTVVANIGGNDMGFRSIITGCVVGFLRPVQTHCHETEKTAFSNGLYQAKPKVENAVAWIQRVMSDAGYTAGSYRLVLQAYPNPVAPGDQNRYPETRLDRYNDGGCPVFNDDSNWVDATVVPGIAAMLEEAAADRGVDFLDVHNLFDHHQVCAKAAVQAASSGRAANPQFGSAGEWARFLDFRGAQGGVRDESVHPNFYGQQALGACLSALYTAQGNKRNHVCTNVAGSGPEKVKLS